MQNLLRNVRTEWVALAVVWMISDIIAWDHTHTHSDRVDSIIRADNRGFVKDMFPLDIVQLGPNIKSNSKVWTKVEL